MRHGRHLVAAALAGPLALSLVAATAPSATPEGTASTVLSAVDLAITTPLGNGALGLVDAETFASTATDAVEGVTGPFASALLTPLVGPAGPVGRTEARSDGATSARSSGSSLDGLGGPVAAIAGEVAPATLSATATAAEAHAVIGTLTARIAGLAESLGVTVNASDIASQVTGSRATATQGLQVSELTVTLGDILPQDVLASLPLPDLLALLESLPLDLPAGVASTIDDVQAAVDAIVAQLTSIGGAEQDVLDALADLEDATDTLAAVTTLTEQLELLDSVDLTSGDLGGTLDGIGTVVDDTIDTIGGIVGSLGGSTGLFSQQQTLGGSCGITDITTATQLTAAVDCVEGLIDDALETVGADSLGGLETIIDDLLGDVTAAVETLVERIEGLAPQLGSLTTAAADLDDLLASLTGLLGDASGLPLVGVSSFDIGVNSLSDGTLDGSSASVLCQPVTVTILAESITTPGCDEGLSAVTGTAALVDGLLGDLTETLNVLPLTDVLTTGELKVDLFTDVQETVVEEAGEVVATAGVTVLDLEVPSITIDPGPVTDLLDQLGLPDVLGTVEDILGDTLSEVSSLGLPELGSVTATLTSVTGELGATGGLEDLVAELEALLAGLDLGELGTLDSVATPGLTMLIDPVSTASFAVSSAAVPADPAGNPAPAPAGPGNLPATGGGLALLGVAAMAGASALRRRG